MSLLKSFDMCWTPQWIWVRTEESPGWHMLSFWNSSAKTQIRMHQKPAGHNITTTMLLWGLYTLDVFAQVALCAQLCLCCTCLCIVYRASVGATKLIWSSYTLLPGRWGLCYDWEPIARSSCYLLPAGGEIWVSTNTPQPGWPSEQSSILTSEKVDAWEPQQALASPTGLAHNSHYRV